MSRRTVDLPYWDGYLELLEQSGVDYDLEVLHSHYGCWDNPNWSNRVPTDYGRAAERMCQLVCEAADVRDGCRILDVGCGLGTVVASINGRHDHVELVGLNIDARQLGVARRGVVPRGQNRIGWVAADACHLPLANGVFDVVLALECTMHFESRARFLKEVRRVLRPGGRLAICEHFAVSPRRGSFDRPKRSRVWGSFLEPIAVEQFATLAEASGMQLVANRDVTRQAVPTCPGVRKMLLQAMPWPANLTAYGTVWLAEILMRMKLLNYRVLAFEAAG